MEVYESEIFTELAKLLRSSIPTECKCLNVLRLGFQDSPKDNPIVMHLHVAEGYLSDSEACQLVDGISAIISAAQWVGEKRVSLSIPWFPASLYANSWSVIEFTWIFAKRNLLESSCKRPTLKLVPTSPRS